VDLGAEKLQVPLEGAQGDSSKTAIEKLGKKDKYTTEEGRFP